MARDVGGFETRVPLWIGSVKSRLTDVVLATLSGLGGDIFFYGLAALFAIVTAVETSQTPYRIWGEIAAGPYLLVTFLTLWLRRTHQLDSSQKARLRRIILVLAFLGTTVAPLSVEVAQRSNLTGTTRVQPEVVVIDQAAQRISMGLDPYHAQIRDGHLISGVSGVPEYESFFPYLPLMAFFGLPSTTKGSSHLTDTRLIFSIFTIGVVVLALWLLKAPAGVRLRILQFAIVLPTASLPLATGGDDLPIVALLLLGIVLMQRKRAGMSGIVLGIVSAMKFTAWPLAFLVLWSMRNQKDKRPILRMLFGFSLVVLSSVVPFLIQSPHVFVANAILFPFGLAGIASPAASPLPGHLIAYAVPGFHRIYTVIFLGVGAVLFVERLIHRAPKTPAQACDFTGWLMLYAICFAPATRVGYLLYPLEFFLWGWMLREAAKTNSIDKSEEVPSSAISL